MPHPTVHSAGAPLEVLLAHPKFKPRREVKGAHYLLLNFWASWCPPCIEEMPSLIRFAQSNKQFIFASVSQDDSGKDYESFLKAFPALGDAADSLLRDYDQSLAQAFHVDRLPETFVFDLQTKRYTQISGSIDWDQAGLLDQIENELKKPKP